MSDKAHDHTRGISINAVNPISRHTPVSQVPWPQYFGRGLGVPAKTPIAKR